MAAGRKPVPTHLKLVTGNPGKRALPKKEARTKPSMPSPPAHLGRAAKTEWRRVVRQLFNLGLLSVIDRAALAAYAQSYERWVRAEKEWADKGYQMVIVTTMGNIIQNPLIGIANRAAADMVKYATEFGMTPAARSRVNANPPDEDKDPTARFFA